MTARSTNIDPDRMYPIGTAARLVGLGPSALRALEQRGELQCMRTPGGQRRFSGSDLLRLRDRSVGNPPKKGAPSSPPSTPDPERGKARAAWLNDWIARGQRDLPADTPAEIRFRFASDLERALRAFGPESPHGEVEPLFNSVVERAKERVQDADAAEVRNAMKAELIDDALAHLRRKIDTLPRRLVGAPASFQRTHIRADLRDRLRDVLRRRLRGDESWHEVRELADEFLAEWYVEQALGARPPNAVKLIAAAAAGFAGGATAAAALDPRIRAAVAKLKDPLRSIVVKALDHLAAPQSSRSSPSTQPNQPAPAPPPAHPGAGVFGVRPSAYRPHARFSGRFTGGRFSPRGTTAPNGPPAQSGPTNGQPGVDTPPSGPGLAQ